MFEGRGLRLGSLAVFLLGAALLHGFLTPLPGPESVWDTACHGDGTGPQSKEALEGLDSGLSSLFYGQKK